MRHREHFILDISITSTVAMQLPEHREGRTSPPPLQGFLTTTKELGNLLRLLNLLVCEYMSQKYKQLYEVCGAPRPLWFLRLQVKEPVC